PIDGCPFPEAGACIPPAATQITGTVAVRGCTPAASDFDIRAVPIAVASPESAPVAIDARQTQLHAQVRGTLDPHVHPFAITSLRPALPYRISIFLPPSPVCPNVFWRSSTNGFASGGSPGILIEGVGVTTRLNVQSVESGSWVGADVFQFTDRSAGT